MYLDGFWQIFEISCPKIYFFTIVKKIFDEKQFFGHFWKIRFFAKKSDVLDKFLVKFPF